MLSRWLDPQGAISMMSALEREMDQLFVPVGRGSFGLAFRDEGEALVLRADLPGLSERDVEISLENDVLSLRAQRKPDVPANMRAVRSERGTLAVAQRYELPCRVDGEAASARMNDGVLTITLPKAKEARARRIPIGERQAPTDPKSVS